jgi:hypothetical protein
MITTSNEGLAAGSGRARRKRSVHKFVTSATQVVARKGETTSTRLKVVRDRVTVWPIVRLAFLLLLWGTLQREPSP